MLEDITREVHGIPVRARAADFLARQATTILDLLEGMKRESIVAGLSIQFGWAPLRLVDDGAGLVLQTIDFAGDPLEAWTEDLTIALGVLVQQTVFQSKVGVAPVDVGFNETFTMEEGADDAASVYLERDAVTPERTSGWHLGVRAADSVPRDVTTRYISELPRLRSPALQVLTLPAGVFVGITGDEIDVVYDEHGSLLWGTAG